MSGGGSSTTQTSVPSWVRPYAENYLQASQQVASQPYQAYGGQTVAQLNPYQTMGYNAQAQRALQGSGVNNAASGELQRTLSGGYLNANPYLNQTVDLASRDVLRNMTNMDARSGSFGNSGIQQNTASALGDISTQIRGQDYANERGRMLSAVGMAPSIANQDYVDADRLIGAGQGFQQQEQANLSDQYGRFREARDYPREQLGILGQGLGMNYGQSSTQSGGTNPLAQGMGAGLTLWGLNRNMTQGGK
jgi:hypothetical protein